MCMGCQEKSIVATLARASQLVLKGDWLNFDKCLSSFCWLSGLPNKPFPSVPLFQSESKCEAILVKMTLTCMKTKLPAELIFI